MDAFGAAPRLVPVDTDEDQFELYARLAGGSSHSFLLESLTGPGELAETSVMGFDPDEVVTGHAGGLRVERRDGSVEEVAADDPLDALRDRLGSAPGGGRRYLGGAVGTVSYAAAGLWEGRRPPEGEPLMEFGVYRDGILYDAGGRGARYFHYGEDRLDELLARRRRPARFSATPAEPAEPPGRFEAMVAEAKRRIRAGEVYQVVLSREMRFGAEGDPLAVYGQMRRISPSPYMFHMRSGPRASMGASPEMLVRVTGREVETFPIAGTRPSSPDPAEDARLRAELLADEKEAAEHTMLVDLGRNDVGRVCEPGSVRVGGLMEVRRFSHVQHMVTHVSGRLAEGRDAFDAFRAVFPAGTVTGAPKARAMEIIRELEGRPRGRYAGAAGYFSFSGCCDFAIAIRSAFVDGGRGALSAGAGIVHDSDPRAELEETRHKAGLMLAALEAASR